jgi:transposase
MQEMVQKILNDGMSYGRAAARYGISERTVRRKVDIYLKMGAGALAHGLRGRVALNRTASDREARIVWLYENRYVGYNFTHFHQKLSEVERIDISYPTVYSLLTAAGHRSPKAQSAKIRKSASLT